MDTIIEILLSFGFNFLVVIAIVRGIYYPKTKDKDYIFTFLAFNTIIFFVLRLLSSIDLSVGFGFGLFAIFSVLRYRTNPIPIIVCFNKSQCGICFGKPPINLQRLQGHLRCFWNNLL